MRMHRLEVDMNLITECFDQYYTAITQQLLNADFDLNQIRYFLPVAALSIAMSAETTSIFQTFSCMLSKSPSHMLKRIDVFKISRMTGIDAFKVTTGLKVIAPVLTQAYTNIHNAQNQTPNRPLSEQGIH